MAKATLNTSVLRSRLKLKNLQAESALVAHHPLAIETFRRHGVKPNRLRHHAARVLASGATMASFLMPPTNIISSGMALPQAAEIRPYNPVEVQSEITHKLAQVLPAKIEDLNPNQEHQIADLLKTYYGVSASGELDGNRLNHNYGYIGAEQHLPRYPGDTVAAHDEYQQSGLTPGRGAWGYFAPSASQLTPDLVMKEKYYFAVQTLYLPDWNTRLAYLRDWYKHRKMVAINPKNGKAVVGVVADSGPSWWTGKVFGGSPEIMGYLNMKDGRQKGAVVLLFVDDPEDKVALGPLEFNINTQPLMVTN